MFSTYTEKLAVCGAVVSLHDGAAELELFNLEERTPTTTTTTTLRGGV